ncbi:hypothetical protein ACFQ1E_18890 [Sphingomonas canadensis]|uniref:Uncharacterized protein n=1 Tax=Sphingomonas canadensis TaxID=1219257 RepID=A0ABW3HFW0_9SPHN|nr:hypothetical protein [Sphingomonas canadensis]MCW3838049.1 hypothetical protein [Sphingomonas canadensis]
MTPRLPIATCLIATCTAATIGSAAATTLLLAWMSQVTWDNNLQGFMATLVMLSGFTVFALGWMISMGASLTAGLLMLLLFGRAAVRHPLLGTLGFAATGALLGYAFDRWDADTDRWTLFTGASALFGAVVAGLHVPVAVRVTRIREAREAGRPR